MYRSRLSMLLAGIVVLFSVTQPMAQQACKPNLSFKQTRVSDVRNQQRTWTAILAVDASHCATSSGLFEIKFIRLKDIGPDLLFTERFKWSPGQVEVSLDFWWDESVHDHWIGDVVSCPCRKLAPIQH